MEVFYNKNGLQEMNEIEIQNEKTFSQRTTIA